MKGFVVFLVQFVLVCLSITSVVAAKKAASHGASKGASKSSYPLWDGTLKKGNRTVDSYLFKDDKFEENKGVMFIKDIMEVIHSKQHPPKEECKNRRFMVLQMSSTSFEGTGSVLKQVMIGLAIAMHSNRTLIWGVGHPFMFEHTKELWAGDDYDNLKVNNDYLDCTQHDHAGGPFGCFLQPISTCSLADASPSELISFSHNAYNESARLTMGEIRKGVALYHPPFGLFDYIWSETKAAHGNKYDLKGREAHLWAAACSAYVFRLKPQVFDIFSKRSNEIFKNKNSIWGMHVRHGDLKALSNVYSYKEVFEFEDFFKAARSLSHVQKLTPDALFVATDSVRADDVPKMFEEFSKTKKVKSATTKKKSKKSKRNDDEDEDEDEDDDYLSNDDDDDEDDDEDEDEDDDEDDDEDEDEDEDDYEEEERFSSLPKVSDWYHEEDVQESLPSIITINNTYRYRTEHGSHTVAANGGCLRDPKYAEKGMRCALNYEDILLYQGIEEHRSVPRSVRLMRVLYESVEDMYLLSRCSALIGQGSSHFSTLAAMLVWAKTGAADIATTVHFLDAEDIETGKIPTALLHGMNLLNGTHGSKDKDAGEKRWNLHTVSFVTGMKANMVGNVQSDFNPWAPENMMRMLNGLPHLPEKVFYTEAKSWIATGKYKPHWPGSCPGKIKKNEEITQYAASTINLGVEHLDASHTGQALQCWADAAEAIQPYIGKKGTDQKMLVDALSVAKENAATLRLMRYAEMVINENHDTNEFYSYNSKYMEKDFDGVFPDKKKGRRGGGGGREFQSENDGRPGEGMMTLEELNEKIITMTDKLNKMKELRDKMLAFSQNYANELRAGNNAEL